MSLICAIIRSIFPLSFPFSTRFMFSWNLHASNSIISYRKAFSKQRLKQLNENVQWNLFSVHSAFLPFYAVRSLRGYGKRVHRLWCTYEPFEPTKYQHKLDKLHLASAVVDKSFWARTHFLCCGHQIPSIEERQLRVVI